MENTDLVMPELLATEGWSEYELPPAGTFQGVCFSIIDLWTQIEEFEGNKKEAKKIRIGFEFADDDDNIHTIYKEFTLSFGWKSKLRQFIDAWNWWQTTMTNEEAKWFNVFTLLNKEATLNVVRKKSKNGKEYADIGWLSPRMKKIALHERKQKTFYLYLDEKYFNNEVYENQPQFIRDKIDQSPEAKKLFGIEDVEKTNDEFEKELEQAQTKWKSIEEVEAWVQKAKQQSEVSEDEAKQVFATTETME